MMVAAPANAATPTCGVAKYSATHSTTQAVSQQISTNNCAPYYASAHYGYMGTTYWTPFYSDSYTAIARPGYSTVDAGQHYTAYSGVVSG